MNQTDNFFKENKSLVYCFWNDSEDVCLEACSWSNKNTLQRGSHQLGLYTAQFTEVSWAVLKSPVGWVLLRLTHRKLIRGTLHPWVCWPMDWMEKHAKNQEFIFSNKPQYSWRNMSLCSKANVFPPNAHQCELSHFSVPHAVKCA